MYVIFYSKAGVQGFKIFIDCLLLMTKTKTKTKTKTETKTHFYSFLGVNIFQV